MDDGEEKCGMYRSRSLSKGNDDERMGWKRFGWLGEFLRNK